MSLLGGICRVRKVNKTMQPLVVNLCIKKLFLLSIVLLPKAENLLSTVTNGLNKNQCSMLECSRISVKFIHLFYPHIFHKSVESLLTFNKVLKKCSINTGDTGYKYKYLDLKTVEKLLSKIRLLIFRMLKLVIL